MRDAVIVGAVRTPVGRRKGGAVAPPPGRPVGARARRARRADRPRPGRRRRRHVGLRVAGRRAVLEHRPQRRPRGRLARVGHRLDARPAVRVQPAGRALRRGDGHRRAVDLAVAGGVESMTRVPMGSSAAGRARRSASGSTPGTRAPKASPTTVPRRSTRASARNDRRALGTVPAAAGRVRAGQPRQRGRGAADAGDVHRRDRPVGGRRAPTRASAATPRSRSSPALPTPFKDDGVVTAGSASQISDGAAALAVTTSEMGPAHGLTPLARIHTAVVAGDDPVIMLTAPIPATAKALEQSGLSIDDIGVYEVNEAFAPVPLAWLAETQADPDAAQPARRRDRAGSSARRLRRPADDDAAAPHAGPRHPVRPADHVRGRRHGQRHDPRSSLTVSRVAAGTGSLVVV